MNLSKIKILVTRPNHQSEHLCKLITNEGREPVCLPVIEIVAIEPNQALLDCCNHLDDLDIAIFISANAVEKTLPTLLTLGQLPPQLQLVAVGKRTAETLRTWGLTARYPASPFNSEAVLKIPLLQTAMVASKNLAIFRGEGGRELLAETLRQRGATVNYVNVYRRIRPPTPAWIDNLKVDIITITSVEGLHNLLAMLEKQTWVRHTPLAVMSQRICAEAEKLGFQAPISVAPTASDAGLLKAIQQVMD